MFFKKKKTNPEITPTNLEADAITSPAPIEVEPTQAVEAEATPAPIKTEEAPAPIEAKEPEAKTGWFGRLKSGLKKSSDKISGGINEIFVKRKLDNQTIEELEELLIMADMGVTTAHDLAENLRKNKFEKDISPDEIKEFIATDIASKIAPYAKGLEIDTSKKPFVILMAGVNGAGKTTTIGKMAKQFTDKGLKVSLVAGDTFRAAAIEQLKVWGERTNCPVISKEIGSDAAGLAFEALAGAKSRGDDVVMIDTAGRLQNRKELMAELEKIVRVIKKQIPDAPHACLITVDATIGQNAHSQIEIFKEAVGINGMIITKLDGTAKGGVLVSIAEKHQLPIHYIGVGEKAEDLQSFTASDFARNLVGL